MSVKRQGFKRWLSVLLSTAMMFSIVAVFGVMPQAKALNFMWPIVNGQNNVTQHYKNDHRATDISASIGTSVMASEGGTVIEAADNGCLGSHVSKNHACSKGSSCPALSAWKKKDSKSNTGGWGNWIIISHGDGFYTVYAHLQTGSFRVSAGDTVSKGQVIASSGAAGETYGAHLHFEMRKGGNGWNNRVNAEDYLGSTPDPDADDLGCTTANAGWYKVNDGGVNINSRHNKTKWGDYVSEYAGGTYVYVNKASGEGSGNIGHVTYNGVERYVAMGLLTRMRGNPIGSVDSYGGDAGSVWLNGWAFDWDNCEAQLQINVYLDNTLVYQGRADGERSDVNATYSNVVGSYHGFSLRVPTNLVGMFKFDVYAINVGTGDNTCLKSDWVTIERVADTEAPVISNVQVSNITNQGYDISCTVTDNVGVNRVVFPTWTTLNDQDDIAQAWWDVNHTATRGTRNGDTWSFHVSIADHNNERGAYNTHIYAYDDAGNSVCYGVNGIVVPDPLPVVTFDANGGMAEFVTKVVNNGDVLGVLPEATQSGYIFEGWFTEPQGGTRMSHPDQYVVQGDMTLYAHWTPASGVGWHLDNGVLTIDCTGAMEDYFAVSDTPWFYARSQIRRVEVSGDVTSIGAYAFYGCDNLEEVSLPQSLQRINVLAFGGCKKLASITIPRNVTDIGDYAFVGDTALRNVTFKGVAPEIGSGAFADVSADVYYPVEESGWTEDVRQGYLGSLAWLAA